MKDDRVCLLHVTGEIDRILNFTREGEAIKKISAGLKAKHADVPWKKIAGMRDKVVHEYFGVNLEIVWTAVERELPELKARLEGILGDLKEKKSL